jgi:predicted deacylase
VLANIHGVEVIASELALALLDELCAPEPPPDVAKVLAVGDVTVVPSLNVDGRSASLASLDGTGVFVNAPRRNAHKVDLNRNWPWPDGARDHWLPISGVRTTRLPWCRGSHPLSEPETAAFDALLAARPPYALLNLHSTGRILTYPWSSKAEPPPDLAGFEAMTAAFRAAQPEWKYRSKQSRAWYPIVGSSNDHIYERYGTLDLTVEIERPGGAVRDEPRRWRWAFWWANPVDPARHIANDRRGCWAALAAAADYKGLVS